MVSDSFLLRKVGDDLPLTVFFSGWATDYRVFDNIDLPTNRLFPISDGAGFKALPQQSFGELAAYIRSNGPAQVSLMGWSLGGFIAADFAKQFPEIVSSLILCGVRFRYPAEQIETTRRGVLDNKERFLTSFYRQCFLPDQKKDYQIFRDELMPSYLKEMNTGRLLSSLDYLAQVEMNIDNPTYPIFMIHGFKDIVAPVQEAIAIAENAKNVQLHILPNAGHAAFLTEKSMEIVRECLR